MKTGILKKFLPEKAFGFLKPDDGSADVFAHSRQYSGEVEQIRDGMKVTFTAEWDEKANKPKAASWQPMDGSAPPMQAATAASLAGLAGMAGMAGMMQPGMAAYGMAAGGLSDPRLAASPYGAMGLAGLMGGGLPAAAGLPAGWEQVSDPTTGKIYYCNRTTGESAWTPPVGAAAPSAMPQMMPGVDYASMAAMAAQQQATAAAIAPQAAVMDAAAPAAAPAAGVALPPGWEVASDPSSGKQYYFNRGTGATSWDVPTA